MLKINRIFKPDNRQLLCYTVSESVNNNIIGKLIDTDKLKDSSYTDLITDLINNLKINIMRISSEIIKKSHKKIKNEKIF